MFGKHLELVVTDFRSFRPDHPIPEDAFPGTVVADQATLVGLLGQATFDANFPPGLAEYIDVDAPAHASSRRRWRHRRRRCGAGRASRSPMLRLGRNGSSTATWRCWW